MKIPSYIKYNYDLEVLKLGFDRLEKDVKILLVYISND
jgi:hypothetical protein